MTGLAWITAFLVGSSLKATLGVGWLRLGITAGTPVRFLRRGPVTQQDPQVGGGAEGRTCSRLYFPS